MFFILNSCGRFPNGILERISRGIYKLISESTSENLPWRICAETHWRFPNKVLWGISGGRNPGGILKVKTKEILRINFWMIFWKDL